MKGKTFIGLTALGLAALTTLALGLGEVAAAASRPVFTSTSADFFGQAAGRLVLRVGDVVTARDPQGVLCGRCVVKQKNLYGFLHVYGDDPLTPEDEGARAGDAISFRVNGYRVRCAGPDKPIWTGDGACINVNLR